MKQKQTFSDKVFQFDQELGNIKFNLPEPYKIINPYSGRNKKQVLPMIQIFYHKYFNDTSKRCLILGSSPARRGSAITGVPFEDASNLLKETGISIANFHVNNAASNFLNEVIDKYGGRVKFYHNFYLNFVCPVGICKTNSKGNQVNCNYYENKQVEEMLTPLIISALKTQISFGIDTSVCYCIGSGQNYQELSKINKKWGFFQKIVPLEHPRFITQYHPEDEKKYLHKYLNALMGK
ncbi:uracil-DNA glycosylase family protein [Lactobacillus huangpiensis]|uniref:uracil-DNA glycosylase family protein n=1 Tax=Lactobacillus huangpiensis TaxID=2799571 RepID=UPI001CC6C1B4|nr:uracil-DNA glycosylase family protein [Lactobacillus huangpiensis]